MQAVSPQSAYAAVGHPGSTTLVFPGIEIEKKTGDYATLRPYFEQPDIGVIAVELIDLDHLDRKQASGDLEQARQHPVDRQVGANIFL